MTPTYQQLIPELIALLSQQPRSAEELAALSATKSDANHVYNLLVELEQRGLAIEGLDDRWTLTTQPEPNHAPTHKAGAIPQLETAPQTTEPVSESRVSHESSTLKTESAEALNDELAAATGDLKVIAREALIAGARILAAAERMEESL